MTSTKKWWSGFSASLSSALCCCRLGKPGRSDMDMDMQPSVSSIPTAYEPSQLELLPAELLVEIVSYLPAEDAARLRRVSSRFNQIILRYKAKMKRMDVIHLRIGRGCFLQKLGFLFTQKIITTWKDILNITTSSWTASFWIEADRVELRDFRIREKTSVYPAKIIEAFSRSDDEQPLAAFLERLLALLNVTELRLESQWNKDVLAILSEALKKTKCPIERYRSHPFLIPAAREVGLLPDFPRKQANKRLFLESVLLHTFWSDIEDVSSSYEVILIANGFISLLTSIQEIMNLWASNSLKSKFYVRLFGSYNCSQSDLTGLQPMYLPNIQMIGITDNEIKQTKSVFDMPTVFSLKKNENGAVLEFTLKEERGRPTLRFSVITA